MERQNHTLSRPWKSRMVEVNRRVYSWVSLVGVKLDRCYEYVVSAAAVDQRAKLICLGWVVGHGVIVESNNP